MVGEIISIIFLIFFMTFFPVFLQRTAYQGVNDNYFKRIKIRHFNFMFKAIAWQSSAERGVIIPMLVIQIMGYIFALVAIIVSCVLLLVVYNENILRILLIVNSSMCGVVIIASFVTSVITSIVSKRREENNFNPRVK